MSPLSDIVPARGAAQAHPLDSGEKWQFSASQISTYLDCPRKWAWKYINGESSPVHKAAELGTETHGQLEDLYKTGKPLDFARESGSGYIAQAALEHLPPPGTPGITCEKGFSFTSPRGHSYRGYIDQTQRFEGARPLVRDFKTTGDLKWAKTPEDLLHDPQAILYAVNEMRETGAQAVDLQWLYLQTKGVKKRSLPVLVTVTEQHAVQVFDVIESVADEMQALLDSRYRALDIKHYNASACEAYGGCPFRRLCALSPSERLRGIMNQGSTSSLLDRLRARSTAPAPAVAAVPGINNPDNVPLPSFLTAPIAINPPEFQPAPTAEERDGKIAVSPGVATAMAGGNSLARFGDNSPPEREPAPSRDEALKQFITDNSTVLAALVDAQQPAATPAKRGRPAGSKNKVAEPAPVATAETAPTTIPAPAPTEPVLVPVVARSDVRSLIGTLFIDCAPMGYIPRTAEYYYARARAHILHEMQKHDFRSFAFGEGPGIFATAVLAELDGSDVVIDTHTPEGAICVSQMIENARNVVRGMR